MNDLTRVITPTDSEWPHEQLDVLGPDAPTQLWVRGADLRTLTLRSVAVTGCRASTPYGDGVAQQLGADLALDGITTVTGLSYGIDAAATRGALTEFGPILGVLASGIDTPWPRGHAELLATIARSRNGALVSEQPPLTLPSRRLFLRRGQLMAALSGAVVIVEASSRSAALHLAAAAQQFGRPTLAVPGPLTSTGSLGTHALLRDGVARIFTGADDVRRAIT